MANILNHELICDHPTFYKFMQNFENENFQAVSLVTVDQSFLSLLHIKDIKNNKQEENAKFSIFVITFKT